ncbi:MAG: HD domain-containing protein [Bacteroidales bacterium]|nr:HD domain-containing protein [Bacteroidales bacterium]HQP04889.1 HD domain-containing protein [Bacteroidales bacterium]
MHDFSKYIELPDNQLFAIAGDTSAALGSKVFLIGGYVRDRLLLRDRNQDIDIVVSGDGIAFARELAKKLGISEVTVFKNFGTAMFHFGGVQYEFVGARTESYRKESRKPMVAAGSITDDQNRRDFTINAMAVSLNKSDYGLLIDPHGGLDDLEKQIIRTPLDPDITFSDDPLRMLRAIRFASQLGFDIESETFEAISRNKERIRIISDERIHTELNKILMSPRPSVGFNLLKISGLLLIVFPELDALSGIDVYNNRGHKDNFYHTLQVVDNVARKSDNLWLRWAALLHDIAKPVTKKFIEGQGWTFYGHNIVGEKMVAGLFNRLKLPLNEKMKYVQKIVGLHMRPIALVEEEVTDSAVRRLLFEAGNDIDDLMTLCEADITSKNEEKVAQYLSNFKKVRKKLREVEEKDALRNFQPPISGEEIMQTLGLAPCKTVGDIKSAIKDAILDGIIPNDKEAALDFMFEIARELGITKP